MKMHKRGRKKNAGKRNRGEKKRTRARDLKKEEIWKIWP